MTHTLPRVVHEHHDVLVPHVDALAVIADGIGTLPAETLSERLRAEHAFITGQLLPHMEQTEATIYPALERLLQNRHSMTPMVREHEELRTMVTELGGIRVGSGEIGVQLRLRRLLYRMHALLKVHLAEEQAYVGILERNLSPEETDELARGLVHAVVEQPM
jgi:Hemerythrin HHE cation binding domain